MDKDIIKTYYAGGIEKVRLINDLEGIRSKEIIERYLPAKPADIIDIGGGTGFYSFWLAEKGHRVTLFDLSPDNIGWAKANAERTGIQLAGMQVGDAMEMPHKDAQFDLALLFGPLYHLTEQKDRVKALSETARILKPGGTMLAAIISRYASVFDGYRRNLVDDERFITMMNNDLENGIHINKTDNPEYFTIAFFHTIADIKKEVEESGLRLVKLIAVEGFGWVIDNLNQRLTDPNYMTNLKNTLGKIESNEDIVAMSPHIIVVAEKK